MIEIIKHFCGVCGEPHLSLAWLFAGGHLFLHYYNYMKFTVIQIFKYIKGISNG